MTSTEITIELAFPAEYGIRPAVDLPGAGEGQREFSRRGTVAEGAVVVAVETDVGAWTGVVANAPESVREAHSGVYSTPSPGIFAVVARGDAYFISATSPDEWWVLDDTPIVAVRSAVDDGLLVLATPWRVVAVGSAVVAWRTPRLAISGITLEEPRDGEIGGIADPDDDARPFAIDLRTGTHRGAAPFPAEPSES
jgi:hypothetical protein